MASRPEQIVARHGVVATDDKRCSKIGVEVLQAGGHAVDAAVAAALALGVVSPASSGIGGGAFMLIREANGKTQALDMRETAPMKASEDMYHGNKLKKKVGILSVAVPGEVAGLYKAWEQYGKLPWDRLVKPAEALARDGFKVSPYLRYQMERCECGILVDEGLSEIFAPNGRLLNVGDICRNEKLADTLKLIAQHGMKTFYKEAVGESLINDIKKAGGILTIDDLKSYEVKKRQPIIENILGHRIIAMPPPSSGGATMMLMLNILSNYQIPEGLSGDLGVHRKIEALKHAFAVRSYLSDPDFDEYVPAVVMGMLSPFFAMALQKTISDDRTYDPSFYGGLLNPFHDEGTSHVSIVDKNRNAVSMTCSVNSFFGSQKLSPSTGIVLNNQMDDFSMPSVFRNPVDDFHFSIHGNEMVDLDFKSPLHESISNLIPAPSRSNWMDDLHFSIHGNEMVDLDFKSPLHESISNLIPAPPRSNRIPAPPNYIAPGKRPLSSMSPTIVLKDGKLKAVFGASGGEYIISATSQAFLNHFVHGMKPISAVMAPRFYHTWVPNVAFCENWTSVISDQYEMPADTVESLKVKGHRHKDFKNAVVCQFVEVKESEGVEELVCVSDPRKGGIPAGY